MIAKVLSLFLTAFVIAQCGIQAVVDETTLGGNLYLVNRTFQLAQEYVPPDLVRPAVKMQSGGITLRKEAAAALESMFAAAKAEKHTLVAVSGYRSYGTQNAIYRRKISSAGSVQKAGLLVAPPGCSEHQLGLAVDIGRSSSAQLNQSFARSKEGQWVRENAHHFGFIIRYKAEWTEITGIADEPWHIRYVGPAHARQLFERDIPLEQYVYELSEAAFGAYYMEGIGG